MGFIEAKQYDVNPWTGRLNAAKQELEPLQSLQAQTESPLTPYQKGQLGLKINGITQNTKRIESPSGVVSYRVPDQLDHDNQIIGEVKHYSTGRTVRFTRQIEDYMRYAYKNGYTFKLYVPVGVNLAPAILYFASKNYITIIPY